MVQQTPQSRLLNNLLKSTKEYTNSLASHLVSSHTSLSGLQAYASASSPSTAAAIFSVAQALQAADDATAQYAQEVDHWRERLKQVKGAEEEFANILRDREILVTRLIKASSKKPTRDSVLYGSASPTASVVSLGASGTTVQHRMTTAQAELQGCERQLAVKQRQLDQIRSIAIRDGLEQRCSALAQLGVTLSEKGNEGVRALQEGFTAASTAPNGIPPIDVTELIRNLPPRPSSPAGLSDISLAPSQSASQLGLPSGPKHPALQPRPPIISNTIPTLNDTPITHPDNNSSDSDQGSVQVIENPTRSAPSPGLLSIRSAKSRPPTRLPHRGHHSDAGPSTPRTGALQKSQMGRQYSSSSSAAASEPRKRGGIFGAFANLLRSGSTSRGGKASADHEPSSPTKHTSPGWHTRTDRNLVRARNGAGNTSGSDGEGHSRFATKPGTSLSGDGPRRKKKRVNGKPSTLVGPAPRKLTRTNPASKASSPDPPKEKERKAEPVANDVAGPSVPPSLMHAGSRHRTASLPGAPGVSPPASPPPRNVGRGKPLKLSGAVEKDPTGWIHSPASPTPSHHRSPSVRSHSSPPRTHQRNPSLDVKGPNLMTLVEDVAAVRQRAEVLKPAQSDSATPHMMLPSEYMKVTTPAHGYGNKSGQSQGESMPVFTVQPPTPGHHSTHPHSTHEVKSRAKEPEKGKEKEKESRHHPQSPDVTEIKHNPPSRSASPLRSALRHPAPAHQNNDLPPKAILVVAPGPVVAPVPVRPALISSNSTESDVPSAYETAHSETSDEEQNGGNTSTPEKHRAQHDPSLLTPTARGVPTANGGPPSEPSTVSVSTELGGADGVTRRKSVRLNVPPTPESTEFKRREKPLPQPGREFAQWNSRIADPDGTAVPDVWADSSEEDEDYKRARHALTRVVKKEKAARAEAIAVVASSGSSKPKKRPSVKR